MSTKFTFSDLISFTYFSWRNGTIIIMKAPRADASVKVQDMKLLADIASLANCVAKHSHDRGAIEWEMIDIVKSSKS